MEEELGVKLLERDYHTVKLTPPGELIYQEMTGIMNEISDLFQRAQAMEETDTAHLVIGLLDGQTVEPSVLAAFRSISDMYPQFKVELKRSFHQELLHEVKSGIIDFAMIINTEDMKTGPDIEVLNIKPIHYYLIANVNHSIWNKEINLKALEIGRAHV